MRTSGQRGLSLLEFTLVVTIFSVLVVVAADRIVALRVDLERAAVQHTVNAIRSALAVRFSEMVVQGEYDRIAEWDGGNALRLVHEHHRRDGEPAASGPGKWSYEDGEIVYRPAYPEALTGDPAAIGRWRVELIGPAAEPRGLRLRAIEPLQAGRQNTEQTEN